MQLCTKSLPSKDSSSYFCISDCASKKGYEIKYCYIATVVKIRVGVNLLDKNFWTFESIMVSTRGLFVKRFSISNEAMNQLFTWLIKLSDILNKDIVIFYNIFIWGVRSKNGDQEYSEFETRCVISCKTWSKLKFGVWIRFRIFERAFKIPGPEPVTKSWWLTSSVMVFKVFSWRREWLILSSTLWANLCSGSEMSVNLV